MKTNKKLISWTLLGVLIGLFAFPFFAGPQAESINDRDTRLIQFEESDSDGMDGLMRSAGESHEESPRPNDFVFETFLEDYHSSAFRVRLATTLQHVHSRPLQRVYLHHSCWII